MTNSERYSGFAIAIAWPETWCKQPGAWYDGFINWMGISKNHYYKVGHAALVLVDAESGKCHYFDFGRYHTPYQYGRVRSEITDDGLQINTIAKISSDKNTIENFEEILGELQLNAECHGEGSIHASYGRINFKKAFEKANLMQEISPISYGPFKYQGSNCSRFVNSAILAGKPSLFETFKLNFLMMLTPTPLNNVNSFKHKVILPKLLQLPAFTPEPIYDKSKLKYTLKAPAQTNKISKEAQWLAGEGAGSWFIIIPFGIEIFSISRFSHDGKLECKGEFAISNEQPFNINQPYQIDYLSHCRKVNIRQNGNVIEFNRLEKSFSKTVN